MPTHTILLIACQFRCISSFFDFRFFLIQLGKCVCVCVYSHPLLFSAAAREAESTERITSRKKIRRARARAKSQVCGARTHKVAAFLFFFLFFFCGENRQEKENDSPRKKKEKKSSLLFYYDIEGKRTKKGPNDQNQSICLALLPNKANFL